jgi:hexosaminidase
MFQLGSHRLAHRIVGTPGAAIAACALTAALLSAPATAAPASSVAGPAITTGAAPTPGELNGTPVTVPALQQWQAGGADYRLPRGAIRVVVDREHADQLLPDARTFAEDLEALSGQEAAVVVGPERASAPAENGPLGDIRLTLDPDWRERGPEASRITVDGDITVAGPTTDGVFSGTRSVLQLLRQSDRIPGGVARDWPEYAERSFMIDNGRKYFTPEWAKRQIRELSYLKYNQFHWHIADNAGFRIESRTHPESVSPEHWTQQQVRELVAYAAKYHLEVVPEIDMPGHMQYALRSHPELQIVDRNGQRNTKNLDPTNPAARQFARELLEELVPLFPGRYVHTGGDEFTDHWENYPVLTAWAQQRYGPDANAQDAVLDFTNELDAIVRAHGKTMRIWNDGGQGGSQVRANRDIVLEYWSTQHGGVLAQDFLDQGFRLVNANRDVLYDVPGATPTWNNLDPRKIAERWDMSQWHDWIGPNTTDPHADGILGGQLHVWNDDPKAATEEQVSGRAQMPLRSMTQHLWGSAPPAGGWDALAARAFAVGTEPQWQLLDGTSQNLALGGLAWSSVRERPDCHESALVDGDETTRWCGPKTTQPSVVVDLGRQVDLGTVVLTWETAFAKGYTIEASDDLRSWRALASTSSGNGGLDVLPVSGQGRYLRLSMTERGTTYGYSLYEIAAYQPGAVAPAQISASLDPGVVLASADTPGTTALSIANASDTDVMVRWSAQQPAGVRLSPSAGALRVPAQGTASTRVRVAASEAGSTAVPISVTAQSLGEQVAVARPQLLVTVPYRQLADARNNVGTTSDAEMNPSTLGAGFDGAGSSYSLEALAGAGLTPGGAVTVDGTTLRWPDAGPGEANNVVANGQSVRIDASGSSIGVLAAASYGPAAGVWVVHYTDGTSETVRLVTPDWTSAPPPGSTVVATMSYRNNADTGRTARRTQVFFQRIALDPAKTVAALTLPAVSDSAVRGKPALHVFDVAVS